MSFSISAIFKQKSKELFTSRSFDEPTTHSLDFDRSFSRLERQVREFGMRQEAHMHTLQRQIADLSQAVNGVGQISHKDEDLDSQMLPLAEGKHNGNGEQSASSRNRRVQINVEAEAVEAQPWSKPFVSNQVVHETCCFHEMPGVIASSLEADEADTDPDDCDITCDMPCEPSGTKPSVPQRSSVLSHVRPADPDYRHIPYEKVLPSASAASMTTVAGEAQLAVHGERRMGSDGSLMSSSTTTLTTRCRPRAVSRAHLGKMRFSQMEQMKYKQIENKYYEVAGAIATIKTTRDVRAGEASKVERFLRSSKFDHLCAVLLITNAVFIGMSVEFKAENLTQNLTTPYVIVDTCYNVWFVLELSLRLHASGCAEFFGPEERGWNIFDGVVVVMGVVEMVMDLVAKDSKRGFLGNLSAMRTIRVARIVRVARVIRLMRFFRSLRMLLSAIFSTLKSCIWTAMLLGGILYMFGIIFTQAVAEHKLSIAPKRASLELEYYFSNLPRSIFTMYKSILGGIDWEVAAQALSDVHGIYVALFILMITFVYLAVMNVVSGLFLQSALDTANADKENIIYQQLKESDQHIKRFMSLFAEIDADGDGILTLAEMEVLLQEGAIKGFLQSLEIDFTDAWTMFKLLDVDAGGTVSAQEFVDGCMRIRGNAKSVHMAQMLYETKWLMDSLWELAQFVEEAFDKLPERLAMSQSQLRSRMPRKPGSAGDPDNNMQKIGDDRQTENAGSDRCAGRTSAEDGFTNGTSEQGQPGEPEPSTVVRFTDRIASEQGEPGPQLPATVLDIS